MEVTYDYFVQFTHFPTDKVQEMVVPNDDDTYTIFIEETLSKELQQDKLLHALEHIESNDFQKISADRCELK